MQRNAMFNPRPVIDRVPLGANRHCYIVDDALLEPERFVEWSAASRDQFRPVDFNAYPGIYLMTPAPVEAALESFFTAHMRGLFDARRLVQMHCRLSMVTQPPQALRPYQWLCHSDRSGLEPGQSIQASVLYLFKDESLGGTSFYEPARPAHEIAQLFDDSVALSSAAFSERHGIDAGYMTGSNRYFRQLASVPARWNRMIFYDGSVLHTGDIAEPARLDDDPRRGRLTFNGFFVSRRHAS
jgi:Family of unknown function (DUF6445)